MSHPSDTVWRGNDPGFQDQAIGNYAAISDVADKDNIYLSDQGWAYRHFTQPDKSEYWDELLWAGEVTVPPGENKPVGVFGAPEQDFIFGNGKQSVGGIQDDTQPDPADETIGVVEITGPYNVEEEDANDYTATFNGDYSGTATYAWSIKQNGVDVSSAHTITNGTTATATITFGAESEGTYVVRCDVSGTGVNTEFGTMEVEVEPKEVVYTIGDVYFSNLTSSIFEILPGTNQVFVFYTGNAPVGSVTPNLTADDAAVTIFQTGSGPNYGGGSYIEYSVRVSNTIPLNTDITLTATVTDATAADNGAPETTATHVFQCEGSLGQINISKSVQGFINPNTLPQTITFTSSQAGAAGDQSGTTIQWSIGAVTGDASMKAQIEASITAPNAAATDITFPAGLDLGNNQVLCTYSNPAMNPQEKDGSALVTILT